MGICRFRANRSDEKRDKRIEEAVSCFFHGHLAKPVEQIT